MIFYKIRNFYKENILKKQYNKKSSLIYLKKNQEKKEDV
jgi:hypothetical protein